MPSRDLKESICTSDTIEKLSWEAEVFFYRLVVVVDDFGLMDGRFEILKGRCFPLRGEKKGVSEHSLAKWLAELVDAPLIEVYEVENRRYLKILQWEKFQRIRNKNPKYPLPSDSNSRTIDSKLLTSDSNSPQNAAPTRASRVEKRETRDGGNCPQGFEFFWLAYPDRRRVAKAKCLARWKAGKLEEVSDRIIAHVRAMSMTLDWRKEGGAYVPNAETYLNQRRWEDGTPAAAAFPGGVPGQVKAPDGLAV